MKDIMFFMLQYLILLHKLHSWKSFLCFFTFLNITLGNQHQCDNRKYHCQLDCKHGLQLTNILLISFMSMPKGLYFCNASLRLLVFIVDGVAISNIIQKQNKSRVHGV